MFKEEMWTRRQIIVEIKIIQRSQVVEKITLLEEIWWNGMKEQEVIKKLEKENSQSWKEDRIVYVDRRIYMLNNQKLKKKILQENHDLVDIGYPGQQQMMELIKRNYWWPGIKNNVKNYIQGCFKCQQNKVQHMKKAGELHPLKILERPWQEININVIRSLPKLNRKNTIVVIVDQFTKMIRLKVTMTNISLEEITKIYWDEIWKLYRILWIVLNDRGPQFVLWFIEDSIKVLGTKQMLSIAYYSQTSE